MRWGGRSGPVVASRRFHATCRAPRAEEFAEACTRPVQVCGCANSFGSVESPRGRDVPGDCRQSVQGFRRNASDWAGSAEAFAAELLRLQIAHDVSRRASEAFAGEFLRLQITLDVSRRASTCWPQERKQVGSAECAARQPARDSAGCGISSCGYRFGS